MISDTQRACKDLVDDNTKMGTEIGSAIAKCKEDLKGLKNELTFTNRAVEEIETSMVIYGSQTESDNEHLTPEQELEAAVYRLRDDNSRLNAQVLALQRRLGDMQEMALFPAQAAQDDINILQTELHSTRQQLAVLERDRNELKLEKLGLLEKMETFYSTLHSKENELQNCISMFEQRIMHSSEGMNQLMSEKCMIETEKSDLNYKLDRATTQVTQLQEHLDKKGDENQRLQRQLQELQGRFVLLTGLPAKVPDTATSPGSLSTSGYSSTALSPNQGSSDPDDNSAVVLRPKRDISEPPTYSRSCMESSPVETRTKVAPPRSRNRVRRHVSINAHDRPFSLSSLFHGLRRKSPSQPVPMSKSVERIHSMECLSHAELQSLLRSAREMPIASWRPCHVLAWVKLELEMDDYVEQFEDNIKSGKLLVELTDQEICTALKISNPMLNKKLRLAIDEYLSPNDCEYSRLRGITSSWVSEQWLPSLGLRQYSASFRSSLVDGRVLHQLTCKQMSKYIGVTHRFHQMSIMRGIELLTSFSYNLAAINDRRDQCQMKNSDLLMWSNQRFYKWLCDIALEEYTSNLEVSGIHGAIVVLESSFTGENLANALNMPRSRTMVRKHLASELKSLLDDARTDTHSPTNGLLFQRRRRTTKTIPRSKSAVLPSRISSEGIKISFQRVFSIKKGGQLVNMVTSRSCEYKQDKRESLSRDFHAASERSPMGPLPTTPRQDLGASDDSGRSLHLQTILERAPQVIASKSNFTSPTSSSHGIRTSFSPTFASARLATDGRSNGGFPPAKNNVILGRSVLRSPKSSKSPRPHSLAESSPSQHQKLFLPDFQDCQTLPYNQTVDQSTNQLHSIENLSSLVSSPSSHGCAMGVITECDVESETSEFYYYKANGHRGNLRCSYVD